MPPKSKFTKEQIISAAVRLVRTAGMPALTARALSKQLNSSVCPIFSYFKNMEEVQSEVVSQVRRIYGEYIKEGLKQSVPFKGVGEQYIRFAVEQPKFFQLLFMSERNVDKIDKLLPVIDDNYGEILESVYLSYGIDGEYAKRLYEHLFIYTHGIATMCATGVYKFSVEEIGEKMKEVCMSLLKNYAVKKND